MESELVKFNHVIIFQTDGDKPNSSEKFELLCTHLANKTHIVIIHCLENGLEPIGNILIKKAEFSIFSEHTPEFEPSRHFGYHRYYIYSSGRYFKTALAYLTDIIGSSRVFVVMSPDLHQVITPIMLISDSLKFIETITKLNSERFTLGENAFMLDSVISNSVSTKDL